MKRMHATPAVFALASVLAGGLALAQQDRFSLKTPNGIAFSEFRDYDTWQAIAPSMPDGADGCGTSPAPGCIKVILGNAVMIDAFKRGIPANGTAVPDGAMMAKIEWRKARDPQSAYGAFVPGALAEVSFTMKDAKRFPDTNGWGYATFKPDGSSDTWKAFGDAPDFANTCHACHTLVQDRDFVFTKYQRR